MTVKCKFNHHTNIPTFWILCAKPMRSATTESEDAYNLLKSWGIFELPYMRPFQVMNIVVAYEAKSTKRISGYEMRVSLVREIHLSRQAPLLETSMSDMDLAARGMCNYPSALVPLVRRGSATVHHTVKPWSIQLPRYDESQDG
jgi:hypothetical protein